MSQQQVESNGVDEDEASGEAQQVQLRNRLQPQDHDSETQNNIRTSVGSPVGAIASLGSSTLSGRRSWATFTSNAAISRSVAESVHQHQMQFLQHRAKFNSGADQAEAAPSTPTAAKKFEIELRALGRGASNPKHTSEGDSGSWVKQRSVEKTKAPVTLQRQGSVRMRVKSFDAMASRPDTDPSLPLIKETSTQKDPPLQP